MKSKYRNNPPIPFWTWGQQGSEPPRQKLPKGLRKTDSLGLRTLRTLKKDKKTGKIIRR